jgi:NarL family two-component system response regulator LiaR
MAEKQRIFQVLIVDDHPMMRRGFGDCLIDTGRFLIAGEAESLEAGRAMMEHLKAPPDLVILDIGLGDENGLDFIGMAKSLCTARRIRVPPVLIYSVFEDPFRVQTAVQMGARGYVSKSAGEAELLRAIDRVLAGELYIDEKFELTVQKNEGFYDLFTRREREILMLVKQNYDNRRIAALCRITPRTVENHLSHIYYKTGLKSREQLLSL